MLLVFIDERIYDHDDDCKMRYCMCGQGLISQLTANSVIIALFVFNTYYVT